MLSLASVPSIGAGGLVIIFVLLIFTGRLVPRRTMEDVIHDRDEWRAAHRISESARAVLNGQVEELLEHARTTDAFMRSLPRPQQRQDAPARQRQGEPT